MTTVQIPAVALRDGHTIPQLGYGTLAVQPDREPGERNAAITADVVVRALDAGYRHIDTAQAYGTEQGVGRALEQLDDGRGGVYVTSKLANGNHAPEDVVRSFERTLANLGVDELDLFLIHWPLTARDGDRYVDVWRTLTGFLADGRLRSAGVSNFQPEHLDRIIAETGIAPQVNQVELHPYFQNHAVQEACRAHGIAVEAHSPLGHSGEPLGDETIVQISAARNRTPARVILRWHMQSGVVAIPKSSRPERMAENLDIFDFELSAEEMASIDALDRGPAGRVGPDPDTYAGV